LRDAFPGRYRPTQEEFDRMWGEGLFVFDANVLLNLYRYSEGAREALLSAMRSFGDRVWLPHRAAEEFLMNRIGVIGARRKGYLDLAGSLEGARSTLEEGLERLHRDPAVEAEGLLDQVRGAFEELSQHLKRREAELPRASNSPEDDDVWRAVDGVFEGQVGPPYPPEEKREIFEQGRVRYEARVPPGYKDAGKDGADEGRFGDLLVWFQLLNKAEEAGRPVVLVTDDAKEDWWLIAQGQVVGPRPELVEEVRRRAGVAFHMYRPDSFVKEAQARGLVGEGGGEEVIGEIQGLDRLLTGRSAQRRAAPHAPARRSQIELLSTLALETWGELGVGMLEDRVGKPLSELTRSEADALIDDLTPELGREPDPPPSPTASGGWDPLADSFPEPTPLDAERLIADLRSSNFERQNKAASAIKGPGGRRSLARLDPAAQERLGRGVVAAASVGSFHGSFVARHLLELVRRSSASWPGAFVSGLLIGALVDGEDRLDPKPGYLPEATRTAATHQEAVHILERAATVVAQSASQESNPATRGAYDEAIEAVRNVQAEAPVSALLLEVLMKELAAARDAGAAGTDD